MKKEMSVTMMFPEAETNEVQNQVQYPEAEAEAATIQEDDPMFGAGFTDCAQEAIEYLLQVEKLDENDPIVVGLKQHLVETQQRLGLDQHGMVDMPRPTPVMVDSENNQGYLDHSMFNPANQFPVISDFGNNDNTGSWWDTYSYQTSGCTEADTTYALTDLCPRDSQITELTCELIDLLSDCPDWASVSDTSDTDNDDGWEDVVEDMELTL